MNKKGMTLIEMVATLLILSIASTMLMGGFSAIIRIMGNASKVKNASNTLLSYVEGSDDTELHEQINSTDALSPLTYTIKRNDAASSDKTIEVKGTIQTFKTKKVDDIKLTKLGNEKNVLVKEKRFYKQVTDSIMYLVKVCQREEKKLDSLDIYGLYNSVPSKLNILEVRYQNGFDVFPEELLPQKLNDGTTYHMIPSYPWELSNGLTLIGEHQGRLLIVTNKIKRAEDYANANIYIQIIYDYNSGRWYYYPYERYKLTTKLESKIPQLTNDADSNFLSTVTTYDKFIEHVKDKKNGWLELKINKKYTTKTDDLWQ